MNNPIKAIRATLTLGDIKLDVLQFPDGSYHLFINQLNEVLAIKASDSTGKKYVQPLIEANPNRVNLARVEGIKSNLKTLSIELVTELIGIYAGLGNQKCLAVAIACMSEALERRADAAFGIQRLEEEYNQKLTERINGKVDRLTFTDAIGLWLIDPRNDPSENTKRFIYSNCSDCLNLIVLGFKSRKAKEILGVAEDSLLRDALPAACLREIAAVERLACILVMEDNMHPLEAVKQASISVRARRVDF